MNTIAITCPDCGGFEMASTRECMTKSDWGWVAKMLAQGWQCRDASADQIKAMPFGCQCDPKRSVIPIK